MKYFHLSTVRLAFEHVLLQARSMWHTNINMFVGICVDSHRVGFVWDHGRNGCLNNVITNDAIRLDTVLKTAFATDIAEVVALWGRN